MRPPFHPLHPKVHLLRRFPYSPNASGASSRSPGPIRPLLFLPLPLTASSLFLCSLPLAFRSAPLSVTTRWRLGLPVRPGRRVVSVIVAAVDAPLPHSQRWYRG